MSTDLNSLFRLIRPFPGRYRIFQQRRLHRFSQRLHRPARESLIKEIEGLDQVREYVQQLESYRGEPKSYFIRPWNERGPYSDQLIDDPFIASLLTSHHWRRLSLLPFRAQHRAARHRAASFPPGPSPLEA